MNWFPRPRREIHPQSSHEEVLGAMPHQQLGRLATGAETVPTDVLEELRTRLPLRDHTDDDPFVNREVDSLLQIALSELVTKEADIHQGRGAVVRLGLSPSKHLFEATAEYLISARGAPEPISSLSEYYKTMYDTRDQLVHLPLSAGEFKDYFDPIRVAQHLQSTTPTKMAWVEQADGTDELYVPTQTGAWINIRSNHPEDARGTDRPEGELPVILLVVPSVGK